MNTKAIPKYYDFNYVELSKTISYVLRHAPWEYELELDDEGWVPIDDLSLARENKKWSALRVTDLEEMIEQSEKQRHEISGNKIRALYGHSTPLKLLKEKSVPPEILYHGTSPKILDRILLEGLKPMNRHYVHLSIDIDTAMQVGKRKSHAPIILEVAAKKADAHNISFYLGNDKVWLADCVPPEYISS